MIDSIHSLAFSIQAKPGIYAVLVGSGISRTAGIPTGWEVTLDLIRKLARFDGEDVDPNPEEWFRNRFHKEPDYSELLDGLAKTPAERQQLLKGYFEPTDADLEQGHKEPTKAHHAIAALAERGFIKAIVTTNFDRLMERALSAVGVEPTVLSTPDQIQGALPLVHTSCCVLKVNGDYLDSRIKNTATELAVYPEEIDQLLDRIFDEFGLIVCGWSGDWDEALRRALERSSSHRFTTYWATRRKPSETAERLIGQSSSIVERFHRTLPDEHSESKAGAPSSRLSTKCRNPWTSSPSPTIASVRTRAWAHPSADVPEGSAGDPEDEQTG